MVGHAVVGTARQPGAVLGEVPHAYASLLCAGQILIGQCPAEAWDHLAVYQGV
jgi:hypothetical protein